MKPLEGQGVPLDLRFRVQAEHASNLPTFFLNRLAACQSLLCLSQVVEPPLIQQGLEDLFGKGTFVFLDYPSFPRLDNPLYELSDALESRQC